MCRQTVAYPLCGCLDDLRLQWKTKNRQHYCQAYGVKPDDELIWRVVEHETITEGGEIFKVQTVRKKQIALQSGMNAYLRLAPCTEAEFERALRLCLLFTLALCFCS